MARKKENNANAALMWKGNEFQTERVWRKN